MKHSYLDVLHDHLNLNDIIPLRAVFLRKILILKPIRTLSGVRTASDDVPNSARHFRHLLLISTFHTEAHLPRTAAVLTIGLIGDITRVRPTTFSSPPHRQGLLLFLRPEKLGVLPFPSHPHPQSSHHT